MGQGLGSIGEKMRAWVEERRKFPRWPAVIEVRLPVGVAVPNENLNPEAEHYPEPIMGRTSDISESGLSLVLPTLVLGEDRIDTVGYPLRIVLCLPIGIVIVFGETVRVEALAGDNSREKYLLGVSIKKLNEPDRRQYLAYLNSLN